MAPEQRAVWLFCLLGSGLFGCAVGTTHQEDSKVTPTDVHHGGTGTGGAPGGTQGKSQNVHVGT